MSTIPTLCGSFAGRASSVGVRVHNAAYRAMGLDYTYVAFSIQDARSAVAALRALAMRGCDHDAVQGNGHPTARPSRS
jgi:shikimate dehydrogenase